MTTLKLDRVLTVAIGDRDSNGERLSPLDWTMFQGYVHALLSGHGIVVAHATGDGVGSDGPNESEDEATAVFIVINPTDVDSILRPGIAGILRTFGASSACFSIDSDHEPVFDTRTGWRKEYEDADVCGVLSDPIRI